MKSTIVIYGSSTGTCQSIAETIAGKLGASAVDVSSIDEATISDHDNLILGTSTWGAGELQDDWYDFLDALKRKALSGKRVALFGSYGWGDGEWMRTWESDCDGAGVNLVCESVICTEMPDDAALEACRALGKALVE